MLRSNSKLALSAALLPLFVFVIQACSDDPATVTPPPGGGGTSNVDGGTGDDDDDSTGDAGADAGPRPAATFLAETEFADLIELAEDLPFGVSQKQAANSDILNSRWGRHGGPQTTLGSYGSPATPAVVQWTLASTASGTATEKGVAFTKADNLPDNFFYGIGGMTDLPFGLSLLDYSTGPLSPYPGEALIYDPTYKIVKTRAKANGFYSGVGLADGANGLLVYSSLSPLAANDSPDVDCALYATGICDDTLLAPAPCSGSRKLFGWQGSSGPVVTDAHGNVFVAASLTDGETTDAIFGLGRTEVTGGGATTARTIAGVDGSGSASLAAVMPEDGKPGYVFALGYADGAPIYGATYTEEAGAVKSGASLIAEAIKPADGVDGMSVFTDADGDLWVAVIKGAEGFFLELRRKP